MITNRDVITRTSLFFVSRIPLLQKDINWNLRCIYNISYKFFENIDDEGFQNLGLFSSFKALKGGLFIVPHLLCDGASFFLRSHVEDRPNLVAFNEKQIILGIYSIMRIPIEMKMGLGKLIFSNKLKIFQAERCRLEFQDYSPFVTCINYFVMNSYMNSTGLQCFP